LYYATFTTGFQDVVQDILCKKHPNTKIIHVLDGGIVLNTLDTKSDILSLPCFNNVFEVLYMWEKTEMPIDSLMRDMISQKINISYKRSGGRLSLVGIICPSKFVFKRGETVL